MSMTPTELTIRHLRNNGWHTANVEKYNHITRRTHDLYGFIDVLAVGPDGTLAVQTTSATNVAARITKIESDELAPALAAVREAGWTIHVHGWQKKKGRWVLQREIDLS